MGRILVTGADGFIGSHLVEELVRLGRDVRAFVLYNSFDHWGWLDSVPAEIKDSIDVVAAMCGTGIASTRRWTAARVSCILPR